MGQYFKLVNPDRKEYVELPGPMKAIERLTNPVAMAAIGYLLLDGPQDGTAFLSNADPDDPQLADGIAEYKEQEEAYEEENDVLSVYRKRDDDREKIADEWDDAKIARVAAAGLTIAEANEYAGRWAGDEVRLVGDYADSGLYGAVGEGEWTDITDGLFAELKGFVGESFFEDRESVMRPDFVVSM